MAKKLVLVKDQLVSHARIAVVGESPGKEECLSGSPFSGPSGSLLNNFLFTAGLRRNDVAVLNVSLRRPSPYSDDIKLIPREELELWMEDLRRRLTLLPELRVIVPLGNTALEGVLGTDRVRLSKNKKLSISKAAGFYFDKVKLNDGREVLVVPNFHPAFTFRDQTIVKISEEIWRKIGEELRRGIIADTNTLGPLLDDTYTIEAMPHPDDALEYAHKIIKEGAPISFDIETPREVPRDKILCVGFTNDGKFGMTIPLDDHRACGPKEWRLKYLEAIKLIVESNCEKIGQNLSFDAFCLDRLKGIKAKNIKYDTRTMHLSWDSRRDHDLGSIVAGFFRTRMWKNRDEESRVADDYNELATYCALDSLNTWHSAMHMALKVLGGDNTLDVYHKIYDKRFYPLLRIMLHGTLVDQKTRAAKREELQAECTRIQKELEDIAGVSLAGEKSLSTQKVSQFLYGPKNPKPRPIKLTPKKGLPAKNQPPPLPKGLTLEPILDNETGKPTSDEVALRKLRISVLGKDPRAEKALDLILDHRRKDQLSSFFSDGIADKDNRWRCSFGFAETGRLTSSSNPIGTGRNAQNVDREARSILLPDDDCIFITCDLSAAEDRLCKAYSKDPELIRLARTKPWEYDAHTDNAARIFNIPFDVLFKRLKDKKDKEAGEFRYLAKRIVHGSQRGLGGQKMADEMLKDGHIYTKQWCNDKINKYHEAFPGIKAGYFEFVRNELMTKEVLTNPWGFKMSFYGERKDDSVFRDALSFLLQSCCVFVLDLQGLIPLDEQIEAGNFPGARINNEAHDAVTFSAPLTCAYEAADFLITNLQKPNEYNGVELSIPSTLKIGASQSDDDSYEWKKFPTKDEFMVEAERIFEIAERRRHDAQVSSKSKRRSKVSEVSDTLTQ